MFLTYGLPGDQLVVGNLDGNGTDTIGITRNGMFYLRNSNTNGFADIGYGYCVKCHLLQPPNIYYEEVRCSKLGTDLISNKSLPSILFSGTLSA